MGMSCFDCHDFMDGYNRGKKEGLIEELKKIKAEIDLQQEETETEYFMGFNLGLNICKGIIQNHISELKGETNETEKHIY